MSLQEKLSKISQNLQETKAETEKKTQEKELEPIRLRIKELENQKNQLDLVKGSLELKSSDKTGKGMREYSKETDDQAKKESTRLDTLIDKNKEALQTIGVENKDQLVENQEFAEEPEVVSYKKAKEETANLEISDNSLKEKLKTLGVNTDEENFSYDSAEKALAEKLQSVEGELLQEKLKTPEGKEEAVETIAKNLEKTLPKTAFSQDEKTKEYKFSVGSSYDEKNISITNDKATFKEWYNAKLLPENIKDLESKYGKEIVQTALKKSYDTKVEKAFEDFDSSKEYNQFLKKQIESVSPQEGEKARVAMREFSDLQNEFRNLAKQKSEELKAKGVDFNPTYASGYGGKYEDFIQFSYEQDVEEIKNSLQNIGSFPPKFDFRKLQEAINKQKDKLQGFVEAIKNLNTKEDVENLQGKRHDGEDALISKWRLDLGKPNVYDMRFNLEVSNATNQGSANNYGKKPIEQLLSQAKTYGEAERYLDKKIADLNVLKEKVSEKMEIGIDTQLKQRELRKEIEVQKFGRDISNIESEVSRIEKNKKEALTLMTELIKLETELPQEPVILSGNEIKVPSVGKQLEQLKKDRETEEQNLKNLKQKISNHESNKPKLFGKDKWEKDLSDFKQEQKDLEEKIRKMGNEDYSALHKKYSFRIPTQQYSDIEKLVNEQKYVQGNSGEVLADLKNQLSEMVNRKAPESVTNLYKEYKDLEKKLA